VFHHLEREDKRRSLAEIWRVLAPGGRFVLLDFGPPANAWERALRRLFVRADSLGDNLHGRLPGFLEQAGFQEVRETARLGTIAGSLRLLRGERASEPA
jgi:SAM-dependent methyltransferase